MAANKNNTSNVNELTTKLNICFHTVFTFMENNDCFEDWVMGF